MLRHPLILVVLGLLGGIGTFLYQASTANEESQGNVTSFSLGEILEIYRQSSRLKNEQARFRQHEKELAHLCARLWRRELSLLEAAEIAQEQAAVTMPLLRAQLQGTHSSERDEVLFVNYLLRHLRSSLARKTHPGATRDTLDALIRELRNAEEKHAREVSTIRREKGQ